MKSQPKQVPLQVTNFDAILGQGAVPGSVVFLYGERGVGKTSLALQYVNSFSNSVLFASSEQSVLDVLNIAKRFGIQNDSVLFRKNAILGFETDIQYIVDSALEQKAVLLIVDSIHCVLLEGVKGDVGSRTQMVAVMKFLVDFAKKNELIVLVIGHVNKQGLAQKECQHLADLVLRLDIGYSQSREVTDFRIVEVESSRKGKLVRTNLLFTERGFMLA